MNKMLIFSLVFVLSSACIAGAEEKRTTSSPEDAKQQMQAMMDVMMPQMAKYVEVTMNAHLNILSRPETAEKIAQYIKNLQDALIKQGFSKEEALRIVTTLPLPSVPPSK